MRHSSEQDSIASKLYRKSISKLRIYFLEGRKVLQSQIKMNLNLGVASLFIPSVAWAFLACYFITAKLMLASVDSGYEAIGLLAGLGLVFPIIGIFLGHMIGFVIGITGLNTKKNSNKGFSLIGIIINSIGLVIVFIRFIIR